jgi:hypothetical protein
MTDYRRIQRIGDSVANVNPGQIAVELTPDAELGFRMYGGRDYAGNVQHWLARNKPGLLSTLRLSGSTTVGSAGFLKHDASGNITGKHTAVTSLRRSGSVALYGDVIFASGSNTTITQEGQVITIGVDVGPGGAYDDYKCVFRDGSRLMQGDLDFDSNGILRSEFVTAPFSDDGTTNITRLFFEEGEGSYTVELDANTNSISSRGHLVVASGSGGSSVRATAVEGDLVAGIHAEFDSDVFPAAGAGVYYGGIGVGQSITAYVAACEDGVTLEALGAIDGLVTIVGEKNIALSTGALSSSSWGGPMLWMSEAAGAADLCDELYAYLPTDPTVVGLLVELFRRSGTAALLEGSIGYGDEDDLLTGSNDLRWDTSALQLFVGPGPDPTYLGESSGVMVTGHIETTGNLYGVWAVDFGDYVTDRSRATVRLDVAQTLQSVAVGVPIASRSMIIQDRSQDVNWGHAQQSNATLWIQSGYATSRAIGLTHTQTHGKIFTDYGGIQFSDSFCNWEVAPVLAASAQDYTDVKADWSGEFSVFSILHKLKAAISGVSVSLQGAYNVGSSIVTAGGGPVLITTPSTISNPALSLATEKTDGLGSTLIVRQESSSQVPAILLTGGAQDETDYGLMIWTVDDGGKLSVGRRYEDSPFESETLVMFRKRITNPDTHVQDAMLIARSGADTNEAYVRVSVFPIDSTPTGYDGTVTIGGGNINILSNGSIDMTADVDWTAYIEGDIDIFGAGTIRISNYGEAHGTTIDVNAYSGLTLSTYSGDASLISTLGTVYLDAYEAIDCSGTPVVNVDSISFGDDDADTASFAANTISASYVSGSPDKTITISANATLVTITKPPGISAGLTLVILASGADRTVQNFQDAGTSAPFVVWINGEGNADTSAITIPSGKRAVVSLKYLSVDATPVAIGTFNLEI